MAEGICVRKCNALREFQACVALQRDVWQEADSDVEPATVFVMASLTGGQVLGAFDGEQLVGYSLAFVGVRHTRPYLHSHHTGVRKNCRNRGIGRMLKLSQREEALAQGIRLIEWTFDPMEPRNAHFNLNRLGAISRRYIPNLYGVTSSPLHRGFETDRLLAEWHLDSPRVIAAIGGVAKELVDAPAVIELPSALAECKQGNWPELQAAQMRACREFSEWFARGYAAVGVRASGTRSAYQLAPWSEF
jgi:predicted GNAT superfamily acetyltransferase